MGPNPKRRRFGSSFSLTSLDDSSAGIVACGQIVNDHSIIQNPTSDNVVVLKGKQLSLDLSASNAATKKTSPMLLGEFLEACRWCKKKIQEEIYMYGYVLFLLSLFFPFFSNISALIMRIKIK